MECWGHRTTCCWDSLFITTTGLDTVCTHMSKNLIWKMKTCVIAAVISFHKLWGDFKFQFYCETDSLSHLCFIRILRNNLWDYSLSSQLIDMHQSVYFEIFFLCVLWKPLEAIWADKGVSNVLMCLVVGAFWVCVYVQYVQYVLHHVRLHSAGLSIRADMFHPLWS